MIKMLVILHALYLQLKSLFGRIYTTYIYEDFLFMKLCIYFGYDASVKNKVETKDKSYTKIYTSVQEFLHFIHKSGKLCEKYSII